MYLSAQTSPEWTSGNAKKWMKSAVWSNGWTVSPHKSVNAVEFACQYHKNKDVWDAAFRFLAEHDLEALSIGHVCTTAIDTGMSGTHIRRTTAAVTLIVHTYTKSVSGASIA